MESHVNCIEVLLSSQGSGMFACLLCRGQNIIMSTTYINDMDGFHGDIPIAIFLKDSMEKMVMPCLSLHNGIYQNPIGSRGWLCRQSQNLHQNFSPIILFMNDANVMTKLKSQGFLSVHITLSKASLRILLMFFIF